MPVNSGSQSRLQLAFKHNSQEVSQHSYQKSKALFLTGSPPAAQGCWQQLNKQQLCLQQPQQGTSVQGCQRASEMSAGSCQHLSLQSLALCFLRFKHMSAWQRRKEVGRCALFSVCTTCKAMDPHILQTLLGQPKYFWYIHNSAFKRIILVVSKIWVTCMGTLLGGGTWYLLHSFSLQQSI